MKRVVETASWFFEWLARDDLHGVPMFQHYSRYESMKRGSLFSYSLAAEGVIILPPDPVVVGELVEKRVGEGSEFLIESRGFARHPAVLFLRTLGGEDGRQSDLELFTKMALIKLGITVWGDSPLAPTSALPYFDRYQFSRGREAHPRLHDRPRPAIEDRDVEQIAASMTARNRMGISVSSCCASSMIKGACRSNTAFTILFQRVARRSRRSAAFPS